MCGICGQFHYKEDKLVNPATIRKMTETLAHRGPDDEGFYISGPIGLGFRRLSIIDLAGGHQPMTNQKEDVWVVCNGEIYNFPELRKELETHGHVFKTRSDIEVIVHGYKQWGEKVFNHLNGMYGLAIWDERKRKLILSRDKMGIKLVYYANKSGCLFWGSEIRSILASNTILPDISPNAIYTFLRYRYIPSPNTILAEVKKLAAGTMLVCEKGSVKIKRWWKYSPEPFDPMPSFKQAEEELTELYQRAVKRQLISDVPLGLLLSGGLDSGLLLALMKQNGNNWKSFSVGFDGGFQNDEINAAKETASLFNIENASIRLNQTTFENNMARIFKLLEEPVTATSIIPMYYLCQRAREEVKTVLMGQGPDELFGGYKRHLGLVYGRLWRHVPKFMQLPVKYMLNKYQHGTSINRAMYSINISDRFDRYQNVFSIFEPQILKSIFQDDLLPSDIDKRVLEDWIGIAPLMKHTDELGGFQFFEIRSSLPDELLMYADKLSMAHGLEVRVPYLDEDIVEYVEKLSQSFKVKYGIRKRLHRKVCERYLPKKVMNRKKLGFHTPVDEWFRKSVGGRLNKTLMNNESQIYGYIKHKSVNKILEDHRSGKSNNYKILFSLNILEECLRNYKNVR